MSEFTITGIQSWKYLKEYPSVLPVGSEIGMKLKGDNIEVRDEYHSMHELYEHRMALNMAFFNIIYQNIDRVAIEVMKSKLHYDGTMFDGYFIVMAIIRGIGQISYHYKLEHWDKFLIHEVDRTPEWDGHNSNDVIERLMKL